MQKVIPLILGVILTAVALPAPDGMDDIKMGALMAMGQMKEMAETGAAVNDARRFQVFAMKLSNDFAIGFGEAATQRSRRAVAAGSEADNDNNDSALYGSEEDSGEYNEEEEEEYDSEVVEEIAERRKRELTSEKPVISSAVSSSSSSSSSASSESVSD